MYTALGMGWISGDSYTISAQELEHFQTHGYVNLNNVVTEDELKEIEEMYMKLVANEVDVDFQEDYGDHSVPPGTPQEEWRMVNVTLPSVHFPEFSGNMFERRAHSIARQLYPQFGPAMVWEYDQLLAKKPNHPDAEFPLHQVIAQVYFARTQATGTPLEECPPPPPPAPSPSPTPRRGTAAWWSSPAPTRSSGPGRTWTR